jgi:hypothetical protein
VGVFRTKEKADTVSTDWSKVEETPGSEYTAALAHSEGDILLYRIEASVED